MEIVPVSASHAAGECRVSARVTVSLPDRVVSGLVNGRSPVPLPAQPEDFDVLLPSLRREHGAAQRLHLVRGQSPPRRADGDAGPDVTALSCQTHTLCSSCLAARMCWTVSTALRRAVRRCNGLMPEWIGDRASSDAIWLQLRGEQASWSGDLQGTNSHGDPASQVSRVRWQAWLCSPALPSQRQELKWHGHISALV